MKLFKTFSVAVLAVLLLGMPSGKPALGGSKRLSPDTFSKDEYVSRFYRSKVTLNNFIREYESKNISKMMNYVSDRYSAGKSTFEDSIREEFLQYAFIGFRYSVDKVAFDGKNKTVLITISYIKSLQEKSTTEITVQKGTSDLIFKREANKFLLWKMEPAFMGRNSP